MSKHSLLVIAGIITILWCATALAQPANFKLYQNAPNPFTATGTEIRYELPVTCFNQLWVEDVQGNFINTLVSGQYVPGYYLVRWDARDANGRQISSGTYLAKMLSTSGSDTLFRDAITMEAQTNPLPPDVTETKLIPQDIVSSFYFGRTVAVSNEVAVIGSRYYDDDIRGTGFAYVYRRVGNIWQHETKLGLSPGQPLDNFGSAVAADGNLIIVGAPADWHSEEGPGAAYVFRYDGARWLQEARLVPRDSLVINSFGYAVAISGNIAVVGDPQFRFVYMYLFNGSSWVETGSFGAADEGFGYAVAVDGQVAVVGAWGADTGASAAGAAYVFRFNGSNWNLEMKLAALDGEEGDWFGRAVAVDMDVIIIGAPYDDESVVNSGSAYIYRLTSSRWQQEAKLGFEGTSIYYFGGFFGSAVAIDGNTAVVGVPFDDDFGEESGSALVYQRRGSAWVEVGKFHASDAAGGDRFGVAVAVSGAQVLVGSPFHDDNAISGGAAYIYDISQVSRVETGPEGVLIPAGFDLLQNYPNPLRESAVNAETTIEYAIPALKNKAVPVSLRIYNLQGQLVRVLEDEQKYPGRYRVVWDGRNERGVRVAAGVYLCTIMAGQIKAARRMTILK